MSKLNYKSVNYLIINEISANQRVDNFLFKTLKNIPKSHIYNLIRSGQVRINKKRTTNTYKLELNDEIRIPPFYVNKELDTRKIIHKKMLFNIIYEDKFLLVIDKPSGIACHGGSGISFGIIEQLRFNYNNLQYLELIHRLDKDTSGLLMIAKKKSALINIQEQIKKQKIIKKYIALSIGIWPKNITNIKLPLLKIKYNNNEKIVKVNNNGKSAHTIFNIIKNYSGFSLLEITLKTGRTHQIRVHMQAVKHPIAMDEKYGDFEYNKKLQKIGLKRMFLHANKIIIKHPYSNDNLIFESNLPNDLNNILNVI